jgi:hypothetical protein
MTAPYERRGLNYEGKPVLISVDAPPRIAWPFLARCHGVTMAAHDRGATEDEYVQSILEAAADMHLVATLRRRDDREIVFEVKAPR